jgi:ankyrin repeat protein
VDLIPKHGGRTNPQTALQIAARNGNVEIAQLLIDGGANVNFFNSWGSSALQSAAMGGNARLVEVLLLKGANINAQSTTYGCPLECAIQSWRISVAKMLLDLGSEVNGPTGSFVNTPLQSAAMVDDHDMVLHLLDRGADANTPAPKWQNHNLNRIYPLHAGRRNRTALQWAAANGNLNMCQMLMVAGADPNSAPATSFVETGTTALVAAVTSSNYQVVELLLNYGANVNDERGSQTALETATRLDDEEMVQLILGWNPRLGNSQIHAMENQNHKLVSILVKAGAKFNAVDPQGKSALSVATYKNDFILVRFLLEGGADPNPKPSHQSMSGQGLVALPLVAAARLGNLEMNKILLSKGANCNQQEKYQRHFNISNLNALQAAAANGNFNVVRYLLEAGAELNLPAAPTSGCTALQAAVQSGNLELVRFMIHKGADLNSPAETGEVTALQAAVMRRDEDLVCQRK